MQNLIIKHFVFLQLSFSVPVKALQHGQHLAWATMRTGKECGLDVEMLLYIGPVWIPGLELQLAFFAILTQKNPNRVG